MLNKRISYIDVAKVAILLVVYGHLCHILGINGWIYSFYMMFFFISGVLLNSEKYIMFKSFFISRIKGLYIPYVFLYLILYVY